MIYLDYAAATPVDPAVSRAMQPFWTEEFYNPSATYLAAKGVSQALDAARQQVAGCIGARPSEIIFTAGGTESDNLAIHGVMQRHLEANLVVSAIEHKAVLEAAEQYDHALAPVTPNGVVDVAALLKLVNDQTVLVSVMYANNEVGTIQPMSQIAQDLQIIREKRQATGNKLPLYLHTDASQAGNYLDIHVSRLGVDLMTMNGGKIYGPKQTGILFVKAGLELTPQVRGGGQERGLRSGTENVAGFVGFAAALVKVQKRRKTEVERLQKLQKQFEEGITEMAPAAIINSRGNRLPNFVHVTFPGKDNERLMMQLDEAGIMCAVGSACQASNDDPSHVLMAMGLSTGDAQSSLRFSMGRQTTTEDITEVLQQLLQRV